MKTIKEAGGEAIAYKVDVTKPEDVKASADYCRQQFGEVTMLINNAGIVKPQPIDQAQLGFVKKVFEVNVIAHWITV